MTTYTKFATGFDPAEMIDTQTSSRARVLQIDIPWNNLVQLGFLSERELQLIKKYDKRAIETKKSLVQQEPLEFANLFMNLIGGGQQAATKIDRIQYVLSLIDELLSDDESFVKIFLRSEDPFTLFIRLLSKNDEYTSSKATYILSLLLIKSEQPPIAIVQELIRWCAERIRPMHQELSSALTTLQTLLRKEVNRAVFYNEDGINRLGGLIRSANNNTQSLYQALTCLWLLSYTSDIAASFHNTTVVQKTVEVLRNVPKEKIVRVSLALFRNLANKGKNNQEMIDYQLFRILSNFNQKNGVMKNLKKTLNSSLKFLRMNLLF